MSKLIENYTNAVNAYIAEFEKRHEVEFDFWVGDEVGCVAAFGDYTFNFSDIKYVIDNNISYKYLIDWHYFNVEFGKKCYINLDSYCRLRRDSEMVNDPFCLDGFEKYLIYMRLKNE